MSTNVIFMGTPEFAVPTLKALIETEYDLVAVVTQPDRPSGRGRKLTPSPVKVVAQDAGLRLLQPKSLRTEEAVAELAAFDPDLIVVAAFGQILRKSVLDLPSLGCLNVHASLLPRWRGAAPVAAAIRAGDAETGVTIMLMDEGMDTGPILAQRAIPITPAHSRESLTAELAESGATLLIETLPGWLGGEISPQPQDHELAAMAPRLKKEEGEIDWPQSAAEIERQVRAFHPWPSAFTYGPRGRFKVLAVEIAPEVTTPKGSEPGTVFKQQQDVYVTTGRGVVKLLQVQPAGKKAMSAEAMLNGQPELVGARLGNGGGN